MQLLDDMQLLQAYVDDGSEEAFETILNRHLNLVYSAALRQVHDPAMAKEVTQTTFIIFAQKAHSLGKGTVIAGWLYKTAQFAAARALRTELRRREREREAALMHTESSESIWEQLSPILDQAMAQLGTADRNALVLRFFENKTAKDVGAALGINEAAAQKRLARAMEKLRAFCTKKGVVLSAAALAGLLSANAVQAAPTGVAAATSAALKAGAMGASQGTLTSGTLKLIAWTKLKIAAMLAGATAVTVATVAFFALSSNEPNYNGKSLSGWLEQLDNHEAKFCLELPWTPWQEQWQPNSTQTEAANAIRKIRGAAIPPLLSRLEKTNLSRFDALLGRTPALLEKEHRQAALALDALGPECKPWMPQLTHILESGSCPKEAVVALAAIGPEGWDVLKREAALTNDAAFCAIWALGSHRVTGPDSEELLMRGYQQNQPNSADIVALWALTEVSSDHQKLIPLLIEGLRATRSDMRWGSACVLGKLGPEARSALPVLWEALGDKNAVVRHDAAQAIQQIDPQAAARGGLADALASKHIPRTYLM
jgi:RNA polymerase sigma factor (sigma-70 family)